jgi:hypothetical protein
MAQSSWPFENIDTSETQFSLWASKFQETGVNGVPNDTALEVYGDDSGLLVRVRAGQAIVRGHYYLNTATETINLSSPDVLTRMDAIVLELDISANQIVLKVVEGEEVVSNPQPPTLLTGDTGLYQLLLAYVTIPNAAASIVAGDVVDKRTYISERVGVWTTATRPPAPTTGRTIGYNFSINAHEYWNGTAWQRINQPAVFTAGVVGQYLTSNGTSGVQWSTLVIPEPTSPFLLMGA